MYSFKELKWDYINLAQIKKLTGIIAMTWFQACIVHTVFHLKKALLKNATHSGPRYAELLPSNYTALKSSYNELGL